MGQSIFDLLGSASLGLLAGAFALAGLSKAIAIRDFRWTLERLGFREAHTGPAAVGVVGAELLAAAGLLIQPAQAWPRWLVAALAVAFALAGAKALKAAEPIDCNCFGSVGRGFLGWRQIVLLPCWLVLLAMAQRSSPSWSVRQGLSLLAILILAVAYWQVLRGVPVWRRVRGERRALNKDRGLVMLDLHEP